MEATPTPPSLAPTPRGRRKRPHPAKQARKNAAAVSVGTFLALTGAFALKTTVTGAADSGATTGSSQATVITTSDDGATTVETGDSASLSTSDWGATTADQGSNGSRSDSSSSGSATTQSHGS